MPDKPDILSHFWQELKRRKVVRVITVYAAVAFVILQLVEILAPSLRLPDWTMNFILVILIVGFIIAIILSWIYDIHPEEGIVKTEPAHKAKEQDVPKSSSIWKIASYISFVVIIGLIIINVIPRSGNREILDKSIAVLPFENMSDNIDFAHLGDAMTDEIIMQLYKIHEFEVRSRTSIMQYKNTDKGSPLIGEELNVNYLLEGSTQRYGDQIRIRIQLIRASTDNQIWGEIFEGKWKDIFDIQINVAKQVSSELKTVLSPEEIKQIEKEPTNNLEAYEYYLLGQHYINNLSQDEDFWRAIDHYHQALDLDSTYAMAYSGLADVYCQLTDFAILSPNEGYPKAKTYAIKALEFNEELGISHCILGRVKEYFEYDFTGAEREYIRALEINSNNSIIHQYYSFYLSMMGRHEEAISHANRALEIDPLSYFSKSAKYFGLFYAGHKSEALELAEKARDLDPDNPYLYWKCAVFYTDLGMFDEALSTLKTQITLMETENISDEIGLLGCIYGQLDQIDKAREQLTQLDELNSKGIYVSPRTRVRVYLGLNDLEKAIEILERASEDHSIDPYSFLMYSSAHENLRSHPRFIELLRRVGLIE